MNTKVVVLFLVFFYFNCAAFAGEAAAECSRPVATIVSIEGETEIQHPGQSAWQAVAMDTTICPGDMLRVGSDGRAAVVLENGTILRVNQESTMVFGEPPQAAFSVLELLRGALHIFSHNPRTLKVITPYVNGLVEGTEFLVSVETGKTVITVFEGRVAAVNQEGRLDLHGGQSAVAREGAAPTPVAIVRPRDAVEWTLYYPAIRSARPDAGDETAVLLDRASRSLSVGQVEKAQQDLSRVLAIEPKNPEALAVSSIIETVRNERDLALDLALRAVEADPGSAVAGLALSYARQAHFDIQGALAALQQAARSHPDNGLVLARLAELYLSVGELQQARETAEKAVQLDPLSGLGQTVLGFVHLSRLETGEARAAFSQAMAIDPALPLARLGLGLARIRGGELAAGRTDLEIAAALDPGRALIRSYLGKVYFEEKRDSQARRQLNIAKELDPADPTPWLYDAIRKETINQPVEALHDLQQSIARNDNRAVYRSRLLLDDDLAARSAGLGRIYSDLGFSRLARIEGWKSVSADPGNYSAHRFLADTSGELPRHEIARVSELLQSQLLQPINITPVQPQLAESNLHILEGTGPSVASANEFNPLFLRDRVALQASGVAGGNGLFGDEVVVSGVEGRYSYSLGQFHYQTDGIRDNNDQDNDIYNAFFQTMLSPATSLMAEIRHKEKDYGDLAMKFDPTVFSRSLRQSDTTGSVRLGLRHDLQPQSTLLGTAIFSSDEGDAAVRADEMFSTDLDITSEMDSGMAEVQHIYRGARWDLRSGAGYLSADENEAYRYTFPIEGRFEEEGQTEHANLYSYARVDLARDVHTTLGLSGDVLDSDFKDRKGLNPKLGLAWQPLSSTVVRAAVFRTVTRRFIYAQTIEPTLIAGFNQFFDDTEASTSWTWGAGVDQTFSADWFGGLEFFHRDLNVPYNDLTSLGLPELKEDDWREDIGSTYLYWAAADWLSLGLEYEYERYAHDHSEGVQGIRDLQTHRVTSKLQAFHPCGMIAGLQASFIDQEGDFGARDTGFAEDRDRFWVVDLALGYRLPKRFGIFSLEIKNLLDERFNFVDTDPANPRFLPEQQILARLTVAF